ncbi:hypothetical protein [Streptomyces stelliscabiei]|uniref:hypothetical protein n=1 Tax=Streptomyces stelliscabiei TaxID=146820 RepID=UPI0029A82CFD|nr:hypothetical protein [Streptomyces stelliscabiei]MDX2552786.1 hypothetical protein [Streptomyces stelliscabiei]
MKWGPEDWARLGVRVRESREAQGYSRKRLSEMAGLSEKSIQLTEEGRVPTRWPKSLHVLEDALGWKVGRMVEILDGLDVRAESVDTATVDAGGADHGADVVFAESDGTTHVYEAKRTRPASATLQSARDIELTQSGHLAQDIFMRQAKRYRKLNGVSAEDLVKVIAEAGGELSLQDLLRLEDGTRLLRMAEAQVIARALDTTVEWLLGSGFSGDAPEEMMWPPDDAELQAEAKAVERRMADIGAQLNMAAGQAARAREREAEARHESEMAMAMLQQVSAHQRELERHYQYLLGRIDSLRAAKGDELIVQMHPVYEDDSE